MFKYLFMIAVSWFMNTDEYKEEFGLLILEVKLGAREKH